jgi:hypothetical protein
MELTNAMKSNGLPIPPLLDNDEGAESDSDDSMASFEITETPTKVRGKIRRLIDNKGMGVKEFCDAINVSSKTYYTFMKQTGNNGSNSDIYAKAFRFFQKRECKGIAIPKKPTKRKADAAAPTETGPMTKKARAAAAAAASEMHPAAGFDVSGIELPDEFDDAVPILDSCDEIRRKINAHMKRDGVTPAQFLRDLHVQYHTAAKKPKAIQHKSLTDFRSKKGPIAGNSSSVYYAAYVYFEKLRLKQGKPKSARRLEVEELRPEGFDTVRRDGRVWVGPGIRGFTEDRLGFLTPY